MAQIDEFRSAEWMTTVKKERLLILGASVRAAAQSAAAAGYEVIAADQFADRDLREICPEARPVKYPEGLLEFAMTVEPCAWMYTGALENYPEIVAKISERHELLGNGPEVLKRVRNPRELAAFAEEGRPCLFPEISFGTPAPGKRWLVKRVASGGGLGVRIAGPSTRLCPGEVFQEQVEGIHASIAYLAANGNTKIIYTSEQPYDFPFLGSPQFHYCGGVTAVPPDTYFFMRHNDYVESLGITLAREFSLRGIFGIDVVIDADLVWLLEVNPRFTASMGLFGRFFEGSLVDHQVRAIRNCELPVTWPHRQSSWVQGSGILYAGADCHISDQMSDRLWALRSELDLADLPMGGSAIGKAQPVLTIFAEGDSREETMRSLEVKANQLRALGVP